MLIFDSPVNVCCPCGSTIASKSPIFRRISPPIHWIKYQTYSYLPGKRTWLTGDNLSYIDFRFAEVLDHVELCFPGCLDKITNIKNYKSKFESLDKIAAYKKSERFSKWPLNGASAKWGGKNEEEVAESSKPEEAVAEEAEAKPAE